MAALEREALRRGKTLLVSQPPALCCAVLPRPVRCHYYGADRRSAWRSSRTAPPRASSRSSATRRPARFPTISSPNPAPGKTCPSCTSRCDRGRLSVSRTPASCKAGCRSFFLLLSFLLKLGYQTTENTLEGQCVLRWSIPNDFTVCLFLFERPGRFRFDVRGDTRQRGGGGIPASQCCVCTL